MRLKRKAKDPLMKAERRLNGVGAYPEKVVFWRAEMMWAGWLEDQFEGHGVCEWLEDPGWLDRLQAHSKCHQKIGKKYGV